MERQRSVFLSSQMGRGWEGGGKGGSVRALPNISSTSVCLVPSIVFSVRVPLLLVVLPSCVTLPPLSLSLLMLDGTWRGIPLPAFSRTRGLLYIAGTLPKLDLDQAFDSKEVGGCGMLYNIYAIYIVWSLYCFYNSLGVCFRGGVYIINCSSVVVVDPAVSF